MSVKIFDTMTTATPNFPLAYAEKINIVKEDGSEADIQTLYNNKELGGGGGDSSVTLTQQEYEALPEEQKLNGLYYTYDTKRIYKNGIQYGASDAEGIGYNNAESGIQATTVQGAIDKVVKKVDGLISDTTSSTTSTWSSQKTSSKIAEKIDKTNVLTTASATATDDQVYSAKAINTELDGVIKKNDAFVYKNVSNIDCEEGSWIAQFIEAPTPENGTFPLNDEWQKIEQFKAQDFVHQICTLYTSSGKIKGMYVRFAWCNATKIENAVWSPWQKICTTKVANVPFTKLTLDSSIFTLINSDAGLGYSVCNGICIITCSGIGLVSVGSHIVTTNIPKPAGGYASNILQTGAGSSVPTTPVFLAVSNNTLTILSNTHTGAFWGTLTYPVAES